jgi:hypothetical protein
MEAHRVGRVCVVGSVALVALGGCASTNQQVESAANKETAQVASPQAVSRNEQLAMAPRDRNGKPILPSGTGQGGVMNQQRMLTTEHAGATSMQPNEEPGAQVNMGTVVRDMNKMTDAPGHFTPVALEWNPLGLIYGGRVSFNAEWAPVTHHVLTVSPYFIHTSSTLSISGTDLSGSQTFTGGGAEVGYRYYTGHRGMNGVFVGPSLILGAFNAGLPNGNQGFTDVGFAVDAGLQEIFWDHLVVGGGVGVEYLHVSHDFGDLPAFQGAIASTGFKPRLLFQAGYGF